MKRQFWLVSLFCVLVLPALAAGQNQHRLKEGARGKVCLECHQAVQEQLSLPSVHTPVRSGQCSDCHNPHAAEHGQLLDVDADSVCISCHDQVIPDSVSSAHQAVLEGQCSTCHDPHAAQHANNLIDSGNALCLGCHEDLGERMQADEFQHSPAEQSCLRCHDPHASEGSPSLLIKDTGELCRACHNSEGAAFLASHMGYPVSDSRCTTCHDPHSSNTSGLFLADVHEPLTNKMCNQCHEDSKSADPLALKNTGVDLCRGCHSQFVNATLAKNRLHGPLVSADSCLNCHSPHASNQAGLLLTATTPLCGTCHQQTVSEIEGFSHPHEPVKNGECGACHSPHSANNALLTDAASTIQMCGECHDWSGHTTHPIGEETKDPRNENLIVDCQSCHLSHGSNFKAITHADPASDLCVDCHLSFRR